MAQSLGRLVLDMAANAAGFERDMQRISKSAKKELSKVSRELWKAERDLERARGKVTRLATAMGALGAVAIAGVGREFRKFAQEADALDKVSRTVSLTVEELQELRFAAEQAAGITSNTLDMAMQRFARRVGEAANDTGELNTIVKELGVDLRNADGSLRSQTELLGVFADEIQNAGSQQEALRIAFKLFDSEGARMVTLMRQGSDAIKEYMEQARQTGSVLTTETVEATVRFNDALNVLSLNVKGLRNQFFSGLIEPLADYAEFLATTEEGQRAFRDLLEGIADAAKTLGTVVGVALVGAFGKAVVTMLAAEVRVTRLAIAKAQATAAAHGYTTAATRAAIATTALGRAANIALGPVGIAIGVLSTLGLTYLSLRDEVEAASEDFDEFANRVDRAANSTREFTAARLEGDLIKIGARISEINRELKELGGASVSDQLTYMPEGMSNPVADIIDDGRFERIQELRRELAKNRAAARKYSEDLENLSSTNTSTAQTSEDFSQALNRLEASLAGPVAQAQLQYNEKLEEARQKQEEGEISLDQLARAEDLYRQELEATLESIRDSVDVHDEHVKALREHEAAMQEAREGFSDTRASIEREIAALSGGQRAWEEYQRAMFVERQVGMLPEGATDQMKGEIRELAEELYDLQEAARIEFEFENLIDSFNPLAQEMRRLGDIIKQIDSDLNAGLITDAQAGMAKVGASANAAFAAMMSGVDRTSSEYKKLERAQQITNVALGIAAILQQGMGDPYTAIPRMIAMAAMVASLGVNTGGMGGGGAASRQETQGTGTVLGDSTAKSESIANAVEITADATSKLVGINRGMLHALQTIQEGIAGAATLVARGSLDFDLSTLDLGKSDWGFTSTKLVDQGIALLGGAISEMTEGAVAQAFATTRKSNLFSTSYRTRFEELDSSLNDQINLIFSSMIDAVSEAGEALGIPLDEIQARIDRFEVQAQEISLKDLSAEEQQEELEAVFSAIFDDLASSVIPFIDQFQQIGEGMGETLIRVATSVQVTQEAINRLGLNISDSLGPERMAQVSVGLIEAAGGIEQFITDMENFVSKFAPEAHQFAVAQSDITRALDQMGFALPESRDGFWELIQAIDGTTEAGQRQIATLLGLTDAADTYYSALEEIEQEREGLQQRIMQLEGRTAELRELELQALDATNRALQRRIWALEDEAELADMMADVSGQLLQELSPAHAELNRIVTSYAQMTARAMELGASESQLLRIRQLHSAQLAAMGQTLRASIRESVDSLFGVDESMQSTATAVSSSMDNIRDSMINALERVRDWMDSSLLSDVSPLLPVERLGETQSQFDRAIQAALGGDVDAMSDLPGLADQLLSEAGSFYGTSTAEFDALWMQVRSAMGQVADMDVPDQRPPTRDQTDSIISNTESTAKSAYQQLLEAQQLIGQIDVLSDLTGKTPAQIAEELNVPMGSLIELMGGNPAATSDALDAQFNELVTGYGESLSPLESYAQSQLQELIDLNANFVNLIGQITGLYPDPITDGTKLPDQDFGPVGDPITGTMQPVSDGSYTPPTDRPGGGEPIGGGGLDPTSETTELLRSMDERLEKMERWQRETSENTGRQASSSDELVGLQRDRRYTRDVRELA